MNEQQKFDWYDNNFKPLLYKSISKKIGNDGHLWYEVWYDLEEFKFEQWFDYMYKWTHLAVECISNWLIRRDKWYWSDSYVSELNKAMKATNNPEQALTQVLNNSIK